MPQLQALGPQHLVDQDPLDREPLLLVEVGPEAVGFFISLGVLGRLLALWFGGSGSERWGRMGVLIPGLLV